MAGGRTCSMEGILQVPVRIILYNHNIVALADGINLPFAVHRYCCSCRAPQYQ